MYRTKSKEQGTKNKDEGKKEHAPTELKVVGGNTNHKSKIESIDEDLKTRSLITLSGKTLGTRAHTGH